MFIFFGGGELKQQTELRNSIPRLTFPQAGAGRGRGLGHFQRFVPAAEGAGLAEGPGEVFVHNVADVTVEVSEEDAAGAQVLRLCRLRAVLQLRVGRGSAA